MAEYTARVSWVRSKNEIFIDNKYSRGHEWNFDGGTILKASASPHIVPLPYSVEENVDPEEAFVASISSCHMLFFLSLAAKRKFIIDKYTDNPVGILTKNDQGKLWMKKVTLRPRIKFSGIIKPTLTQIEEIHHQSHNECFIATSVKSEVVIEIIDEK